MTTQFKHESSVELQSGAVLNGFELAYDTYGELNKKKDNVVLICHPLTGDSKAMEWWPKIVGPGLAIDTNRYFVVCSNVLGGCKGSTGPSSINPGTNAPFGLGFPVITISDMVRAQRQLLTHLEITHIRMVIGGSMGGMQALEWVAQAPDMVASCVPIAACHQVSPLAIAFDSVARKSIMTQLSNGREQAGLALARELGHITYLSDNAMGAKFSRRLQNQADYAYTLAPEFEIESYLRYQGEKFIQRFDCYSYLVLTKAVSYFDLDKAYGSLEKALGTSSSKFLVLSISSDWLYTPKQSKSLVYQLMKMNKHVTYVDIDSDYGHDTFLIDSDQTKQVVQCFLESV